MKLTKYQIDELVPLIEIREDSINDDPESATEQEALPHFLQTLKHRILSGEFEPTPEEIIWIKEEAENRIEIANDFSTPDEKMSRMANIKSMQNLIDKL